MLLVSAKNRCRLTQLYNCGVGPVNYYFVQQLQYNKVVIYTRYQGLVTCNETYYRNYLLKIYIRIYLYIT